MSEDINTVVDTEVMPEEIAAEVAPDAVVSDEVMVETARSTGVDPELKNKVEAVLFVTDKALHAQAIARITNTDVQLVRQAILELINQYESSQTALEIAQDNGYMIEVKPEYSTIMQEFLPLDIPTSLLRTLSAIAIRAPVPQSEIVQMRGAGAYDHIRDLVERDLIHKKEEGRSPILSTTKKFQQYFRLSSDGSELRKYVKQQEKLLAAQREAQAKAEEAGAVQLKIESAEAVPVAEATFATEIATETTPVTESPSDLQDFTPDDTGSLTD